VRADRFEEQSRAATAPHGRDRIPSKRKMRNRDEPARLGAVLYDGVEPLDVAGTIGVVSIAARVLPAIEAVTIAHAVGPLALAGGPTVVARHGFADAPPAGERRSRMPLCSPSPAQPRSASCRLGLQRRAHPRAAGLLDCRAATPPTPAL
jgi:hypothetical protein